MKNSTQGTSLTTNSLIDANTRFKANEFLTLPDCKNQTNNPACPIKMNEHINDNPPKLDEVAQSGMNIGVAKNLMGSLSAIGAANKSGNYNAGISAILNSGSKNALASGLKTLNKVIANYEKTNQGKSSPSIKGQIKDEIKNLAKIYNKVAANNSSDLAQANSLPKGFDAKISDESIDKISDKATNLDTLVKLDNKEKAIEKPKANFTVSNTAAEDDKKSEIMNLFSGTGEEATTQEEQSVSKVAVAPENQESPDLSASEINNEPDKNLFKLLSVRYFKTVYPIVLESEAVVEVKPPLASPAETNREPASK